MKAEVNTPENFQYELSAFLSAARSILQYSLKEAQHKSGGQKWYDDYIAGSAILVFFKDKSEDFRTDYRSDSGKAGKKFA